MEDKQKQIFEWKRKSWSIPELRGRKQDWYAIVVELMQLLKENDVVDLNTTPQLKSTESPYPWRNYASFLKGIGFVINNAGKISLTDKGAEFCENPSKRAIADAIQDKYKIFGEILIYIQKQTYTIEEIDEILRKEFLLDWTNLNNTRRRMDWLEVSDLLVALGNRKWGLSEDGKKALDEWSIVSPEVVSNTDIEKRNVQILAPPTEIQELLKVLVDNPELHKKRNTYNMWMPSPNRIENLKKITQFAFDSVSRSELFEYIENEFNLKVSSAESMMPFLKADGLIEEVGRNIYVATPAAKAWCESGSDLDLIRIIHSHKRFVGEIILSAKEVVTRNEIYVEAAKYGINTEKARWIMGLLLEAGLLEETQYLHVKATVVGIQLAEQLPIMSEELLEEKDKESLTKSGREEKNEKTEEETVRIFELLSESARDPMAENKASGVAFEEILHQSLDIWDLRQHE